MTYSKVAFTLVLVGVLGACHRESAMEDQARHLVASKNPGASAAMWSKVGTLECRASRKDICGPHGCSDSIPQTFVRLTPGAGSYQRCDSKGCENYKANVSYSGIWTTMSLPDNATFARLTNSLDFVEVAAMNDTLYLYRGTCRPLSG
jgi:hypothetical protein